MKKWYRCAFENQERKGGLVIVMCSEPDGEKTVAIREQTNGVAQDQAFDPGLLY